MNYLIVSLGAAIGGVLRFWFTNMAHKVLPGLFPFGTLSVNFIGSFLLGVIAFYFDQKGMLNYQMRIFLTIGICGGFTTFSTFTYETVMLLGGSQYALALTNIMANVILCIAGLYLAIGIVKLIG